MVKPKDLLASCTGFEWDEGNRTKSWAKHGVSEGECEQVFFRQPLIARRDKRHSKTEHRYFALGKTDADRLLFVVFTIRRNSIRVISARDMTDKERRWYSK